MKIVFFIAEDFSPGAGYLISFLKSQGHEVKLVFDPRQFSRGYSRNKFFARVFSIENHNLRIIKKFNPDICCFSVVTAHYLWALEMAERVKKEVGCKIIFGGVHPTLVPEEVKKHSFIDEVVTGCGIEYFGGKFDPDNLWPEREMFLKELPTEHRKEQLFMTSFGCPFNPLRGDTPCNTIYGDIPIKELYEKGVDKFPVYSYNFEKDRVEISDAVHIEYFGKRELVRVEFDDGTHIDCSPEHRFWTFKIGNMANKSYSEEKSIEAKDLTEGQRVRAIRFETNGLEGQQYTDVTWKRRVRARVHRLIMEYKLGRTLNSCECIHHIDGNKLNNHPDNLELCLNQKDHYRKHPEISKRMIESNPSINLSHEFFVNLGRMQKGKKRTLQARINYRNSKIGIKNPIYKHGERSGRTRITEINHRVSRVTFLTEKDDVYCMTLPKNGWFFANNVLVSNCSFCGNEQLRKVNKHRMIRRTVEGCIKELEHLKKRGMKYVLFVDDIFTCDSVWLADFLVQYKLYIDLPFCCFVHPKFINEITADTLRASGCHIAWMGIQTGHEQLRRDILGRNETNKEIIEAAKAIKKANIKLMVDHIFGIPFESEMTQDLSYALYREIKPDIVNCYQLLYFPKAKIIEHAVKFGYLSPGDDTKINSGKGIVYQTNNKGQFFYDMYAKGMAAIPLHSVLWELLPMIIIKLIVHIKAGRLFMVKAIIENELYFTGKSIFKKL